jgi:hypothetical protein
MPGGTRKVSWTVVILALLAVACTVLVHWLATREPEQNTYFAGTYEGRKLMFVRHRLTLYDDGTGKITTDSFSSEVLTQLTWKRTEKGIELVYPSGKSDAFEDLTGWYEINKPGFEQKCLVLSDPEGGMFPFQYMRVGLMPDYKLRQTKSTALDQPKR